jgi:hypothetical protein
MFIICLRGWGNVTRYDVSREKSQHIKIDSAPNHGLTWILFDIALMGGYSQ